MPILAGRSTARGQVVEHRANLLERQADPLGGSDERDPANGVAGVAPLVARCAERPDQRLFLALVFIAQDRFFPNRLVPRIVACLSLVWTASALSGPLIGGAFATAGLWRFAFWSFALQGLVLAAALRPLLARAGSDSAMQVRRVPVARLLFVAGAILAISLAGAIGSIIASALLLLAGCMCLWLFVARDSATSRRSRLLPGHLGRRGLSDLHGLLIGSVTHKVSQLADCACLTVK